jgi:hypothetical protein
MTADRRARARIENETIERRHDTQDGDEQERDMKLLRGWISG